MKNFETFQKSYKPWGLIMGPIHSVDKGNNSLIIKKIFYCISCNGECLDNVAMI